MERNYRGNSSSIEYEHYSAVAEKVDAIMSRLLGALN